MNANDPVFPVVTHSHLNKGGFDNIGPTGLTKRELFAAMAMQCESAEDFWDNEGERAKFAVRCADALIAELSK